MNKEKPTRDVVLYMGLSTVHWWCVACVVLLQVGCSIINSFQDVCQVRLQITASWTLMCCFLKEWHMISLRIPDHWNLMSSFRSNSLFLEKELLSPFRVIDSNLVTASVKDLNFNCFWIFNTQNISLSQFINLVECVSEKDRNVQLAWCESENSDSVELWGENHNNCWNYRPKLKF